MSDLIMREKLIELLWANYNDHPSAFSGLTDEFEHEADYLLSNGVVVRKKGEWIECGRLEGKTVMKCAVCGQGITSKFAPVYCYCPNCGADMR